MKKRTSRKKPTCYEPREKVFDVCGHKVTVKISHEFSENAGDFDFDRGRETPAQIRVSPMLPPQSFKDVLAHEVMHAAIELSTLSELFNEDQEEAICKLTERHFVPAWEQVQELLND